MGDQKAEYKVIGVLMGSVEQVLNSYAREGWVLLFVIPNDLEHSVLYLVRDVS